MKNENKKKYHVVPLSLGLVVFFLSEYLRTFGQTTPTYKQQDKGRKKGKLHRRKQDTWRAD